MNIKPRLTRTNMNFSRYIRVLMNVVLFTTVAPLFVTGSFIGNAYGGDTELISISLDGNVGEYQSEYPSISADGRYVAFQSRASNLVQGDTNNSFDVFVRDREENTTIRVSVTSDGTQVTYGGYDPAISADGRFIAFLSYSSELVEGDTNTYRDVFVHDRETGITERVSIASNGDQGNNNCADRPSISADGRYVAFNSFASNLVPNDNNSVADIFVHDRETGMTERVNIATDGTEGVTEGGYPPSISADGRYVAFCSDSENLVPGDSIYLDVFVRDRQNQTTELISMDSNGIPGDRPSWSPSISADGNFVAFISCSDNLVPNDNNDMCDVFVHNRMTGSTELVSVASDGTLGDNDSIEWTSVSADGRYIAFVSEASNLVPGDTNGGDGSIGRDVFVHDRWYASGLFRILVLSVD